MKYHNMEPAIFIERPNRFIAYVETAKGREICHVKNTGRCRELLIPGAQVYVERNSNPARKTPLDLITVRKGERLINMDSQVPNLVAREWIDAGGLDCKRAKVRPETKYGNSRFDLYIEDGERRIFVEVKGCTLEENGVCRFPDAPTERGTRHVYELIEARRAGYEANVLLVIQMENVCCIKPNDRTDPAFSKALREAAAEGVGVIAIDCVIEPDSICPRGPVPVVLE